MRITTDIFARVYDRISSSIQDIDIKSVRTNGGKVMDLLLGVPSFKAFIEDGKNMISLLKDFRTGEYRDISWATVGAYEVKAQARCNDHRTIESAWSSATTATTLPSHAR